MENPMFCFQCQEAAGNVGCTKVGVCGKPAEVANIQDAIVYATKGISEVTTRLRAEGKPVDKATNHLITLNLFTTITNANFDEDVFIAKIKETLKLKQELIEQLSDKSNLSEAALWFTQDDDEIRAKGEVVGVLNTENEDIRSLRELTIYGLKGLSAYSKHANVLMKDDEEVDAFLQEALAKL